MKNISFYLFSVLLVLIFSSQSFPHSISDSTGNEVNGEIQSKKGSTIKISITSSTLLPNVGATGILSKYFEEEILGFNTHGYIEIAEVEVTAVTESEITFSLIKELSKIKINGKKENHFKKGNIVRFLW